jgi:ApaG protein
MQFEAITGLKVRVDKIEYEPSRPAPPDRPHAFIYNITIQNNSNESVDIFGRKWVLRSVDGLTHVVEGDGVVAVFPHLNPGESFTYESYHVIKYESYATGSFFGKTAEGRPVYVRIPEFEMHPPMMA